MIDASRKLTLPQPFCDCTHHAVLDVSVYLGEGVLEDACLFIREDIPGQNALLVTDNRLYGLFGERVVKILGSCFSLETCILHAEHQLAPDEPAVGRVLMEVGPDTSFLVALGSGTVNDIVRYVSSRTGLPYVSIGTAPSMDGYVSVVSALIKGKAKINRPSACPKVGIYDTDIMKTAPEEMFFWGFGDIMGKIIARADWMLSHLVTGERICPFCLELSGRAVDMCIQGVGEIRQRTAKGTRILTEALLLTGLAMLLNTDSRPAASNEHNMGHFWEMMKIREGVPHPAHGEAVGVATLYCLDFYRMFFDQDFTFVDIDRLVGGRVLRGDRDMALRNLFGEEVAGEIIASNPGEPVDDLILRTRIENLVLHRETLKGLASSLPGKETLMAFYKALGGKTSALEIGIDPDLLKKSLLYAKDYRSRYTVFKTAEELGMLHAVIEGVLSQP
ncbi:MAG: iron-containing alcohol dehydrogenase [Clostridia bacterium]